MTVDVRVVSSGSVESASNFKKNQKFDTDETSVSAREKYIEQNMLLLIDRSIGRLIA